VRIILVVLLVLLIAAQLRLWSELSDVRDLRAQLEEQLEENARLQARNDALAAEVDDLRSGMAALEERARSELGLIQEGEEFFLIINPNQLDPEG